MFDTAVTLGMGYLGYRKLRTIARDPDVQAEAKKAAVVSGATVLAIGGAALTVAGARRIRAEVKASRELTNELLHAEVAPTSERQLRAAKSIIVAAGIDLSEMPRKTYLFGRTASRLAQAHWISVNLEAARKILAPKPVEPEPVQPEPANPDRSEDHFEPAS